MRRAAGASTQHGLPNLFIMSVTQSGLSLNSAHMIAEQAKHLTYILGRATKEGITFAEVTAEAEHAWVDKIDRTAINIEEFQSECTPSYFNGEGDLTGLNRRNSAYGGGPLTFYRILENWRAGDTMPGIRQMRGADVISDGQLNPPVPIAATNTSADERT